MRQIALAGKSLEHLQHFALNDVRLLRKILDLFEDIRSNPFTGLGKPEALKGDLKGYWSRRINDEHRIVYSVTNETITIISYRSHYKI